ncbi:hypothetical protein AC578_3526 [Pseudocercospora eumusae]|uniref:Uncharacterized protein n=1 Tax=Pseudocercospora eumusae TaxID=321146 RepID=A0A139H9I5_9PEZI|nr:hypothetical protein AC578_3526 [Pseudocercospora eumusae]
MSRFPMTGLQPRYFRDCLQDRAGKVIGSARADQLEEVRRERDAVDLLPSRKLSKIIWLLDACFASNGSRSLDFSEGGPYRSPRPSALAATGTCISPSFPLSSSPARYSSLTEAVRHLSGISVSSSPGRYSGYLLTYDALASPHRLICESQSSGEAISRFPAAKYVKFWPDMRTFGKDVNGWSELLAYFTSLLHSQWLAC